MKLAGMVVLYNPDTSVIKNIKTYVNQLPIVYVIDNSDQADLNIIKEIKEIESIKYVSLNGNKGIDKALNKGLCLAASDDYKYLLTMDQDSKFDEGGLDDYIKKAESLFRNRDKLILCGPSYIGCPDSGNIDKVEKEIITSGMILNIEKANKIGGFVNDYFIDFVDYEFCYRARKNKYECILIGSAKLTHQVGSINPIKAFGIKFNNHNQHSKIRFYYIYRNALYVIVKYKDSSKKTIVNLAKIFFKIILVECNKKDKMLYAYRGVRDFFKGRKGEYVDKR